MKQLFIEIAPLQEVKVYHYTLDKLLEHGPLDYQDWDNYYLKLIQGVEVVGREGEEEEHE